MEDISGSLILLAFIRPKSIFQPTNVLNSGFLFIVLEIRYFPHQKRMINSLAPMSYNFLRVYILEILKVYAFNLHEHHLPDRMAGNSILQISVDENSLTGVNSSSTPMGSLDAPALKVS